MVLSAAARSAAADGFHRCAVSLRLDGRATALIAAMACARWTKNTPALFAQSKQFGWAVKTVACSAPDVRVANTDRVSQRAPARLFTQAAHHGPNTAPTGQLNRVSLPHTEVIGPVVAGVSLWRAGDLEYLVVPGNVGDDDLLAELVDLVLAEVAAEC